MHQDIDFGHRTYDFRFTIFEIVASVTNLVTHQSLSLPLTPLLCAVDFPAYA
jgi:hypothetical protein